MKTNPHSTTRSLVLAALFLALAFVLPMITGHVPQVGNMLCPMHFPILLCGFVLGGPWGLAVGFIAPLVRSVLFGMPPMFPIAIAMAFELAGITKDTPNPQGGEYLKTDSGELLGCVTDTAMYPISGLIPDFTIQ
mgnify:CR=1 FL=1